MVSEDQRRDLVSELRRRLNNLINAKPVTPVLQTFLWRSLHCYIGVFILFTAQLAPYFIHCSRIRKFDFLEISIGAVFVALIPAVLVGSIAVFASPKVWMWICLIFVGLAVLYGLILWTAPASYWTC